MCGQANGLAYHVSPVAAVEIAGDDQAAGDAYASSQADGGIAGKRGHCIHNQKSGPDCALGSVLICVRVAEVELSPRARKSAGRGGDLCNGLRACAAVEADDSADLSWVMLGRQSVQSNE